MNREQIAEVIGRHLAIHVSRNRMPHMSGDPRMRLPDHIRESFDLACQEAADAIMALDGWQTIESAPMDVDVLVFGRDPRGRPYMAVTAYPSGWADWPSSYMAYAGGLNPTHFRPLPQPPGDAG